MLAAMGYLTPELVGKFPGELAPSLGLKYSDIPNGLEAIAKVPLAGWCQILAYCFFVEVSSGFDEWKTGTPGDYGWKKITSKDPEVLKRKLNSELANGRLAMVAIMGMLFQNGYLGTTNEAMWIPGGNY